jgi:hypothetical protein
VCSSDLLLLDMDLSEERAAIASLYTDDELETGTFNWED